MVQVQPTNSGDRVLESHPREWVDCSDPACGDRRLVGKAGSEESHPLPWVGFPINPRSSGRPDLKNPPTPVGGIPEFCHTLFTAG
jgi:hypothetical protein